MTVSRRDTPDVPTLDFFCFVMCVWLIDWRGAGRVLHSKVTHVAAGRLRPRGCRWKSRVAGTRRGAADLPNRAASGRCWRKLIAAAAAFAAAAGRLCFPLASRCAACARATCCTGMISRLPIAPRLLRR